MQTTAVRQHFAKAAPFWKNVYGQTDVYAVVHQQRRDVVLSMVDQLSLASGTPVLDIGCGAGTISVPLATRGLKVQAVDAVPEMITLTKRLASDSGVGANLEAHVGDIYHLNFPPNSFQLVLAVGVLPWLDKPEVALQEMARVLKPGGHLIVNVDNCWGMHRVLDPISNFWLAPLRNAVGLLLRLLRLRTRPRGLSTFQMSSGKFDSLLRANGLEPEQRSMIGFGPFSFWQHELFPAATGVKVHHWLQTLSDKRAPVIRSMGGQYLVLTQKRKTVH